jgi:hypothetical protein
MRGVSLSLLLGSITLCIVCTKRKADAISFYLGTLSIGDWRRNDPTQGRGSVV